MQSPRLLALSSIYEFLLITHTWLSGDIIDNAIANPRYLSLRKISPSQMGLFLVYVRNSIPVSICEGP